MPGGNLTIESYESQILDYALCAADGDRILAHPMWFVVASVRCLGVTTAEFCQMAAMNDLDALLFGGVELHQIRPLLVGGDYSTKVDVTGVKRRRARDGATLDCIDIRVEVVDADGNSYGSVISNYLIKRSEEK